jgi:hypothetical protein
MFSRRSAILTGLRSLAALALAAIIPSRPRAADATTSPGIGFETAEPNKTTMFYNWFWAFTPDDKFVTMWNGRLPDGTDKYVDIFNPDGLSFTPTKEFPKCYGSVVHVKGVARMVNVFPAPREMTLEQCAAHLGYPLKT